MILNESFPYRYAYGNQMICLTLLYSVITMIVAPGKRNNVCLDMSEEGGEWEYICVIYDATEPWTLPDNLKQFYKLSLKASSANFSL